MVLLLVGFLSVLLKVAGVECGNAGAQSPVSISNEISTLTDWLQIIFLTLGVIGLLLTGIGLLLTFLELRTMSHQNWISIYSDYTKRYAEIIRGFPERINEPDFSIKSLPPEKREETMRHIRLYFDLCYEEFSLYHTYKRIKEKLWKDWREGIEAAMSKKSFQDAWKQIREDTLFSKTGDFSRFIDEIINQSRRKDTPSTP